MLCKGSGKNVAAAVVADEVEETQGCGFERGPDRGFAGAGNRPGRQARVPIGIVRRIKLQIVFGDGPDGTMIQPRGVNHRGVALQSHSFREPIYEDTGHDGTLAGHRGFFLDQRGERDHVV